MRIIDEKLLATFRGVGRCEACRKLVSMRECAHILGKGMGGGRRIDNRLNLVSLCGIFTGGNDCHYRHHLGRSPTADELWEIVGKREGVSGEAAREEIYRLRRL
jgi:hypothetical protein